MDAVLVFDEAEGLFGSRSSDGNDGASRHDTQNVRPPTMPSDLMLGKTW